MSKTYQAVALGDTVHFKAESLDDAKSQLIAMCGPIPDSIVEWEEMDSLPDGCVYAADMRF